MSAGGRSPGPTRRGAPPSGGRTPRTITNSLLGALALPADGVADNVPQLRDQYGADLVTVIASGRAAGGLGYTPPEPGPSTAAWGYSVVGRGAVGNYSMGHEIGHNLSADHDRVTQPVQPENGATGYFPAKGDWSSLMAYESSCRKATKGACTRINHFSNPKQKYRGEPIGIPIGKPGQADSSDVLSKTGVAVAAYRAAKTSYAMCAVTSSVSPAGQQRHRLAVAGRPVLGRGHRPGHGGARPRVRVRGLAARRRAVRRRREAVPRRDGGRLRGGGHTLTAVFGRG